MFNTKTGQLLELLTPETHNLQKRSKVEITKDKNKEDDPKIHNTEMDYAEIRNL